MFPRHTALKLLREVKNMMEKELFLLRKWTVIKHLKFHRRMYRAYSRARGNLFGREIWKSSRRSSMDKSLRRRWFFDKCLSRTTLSCHSRCSFSQPRKNLFEATPKFVQYWKSWSQNMLSVMELKSRSVLCRRTGLNPGWLSDGVLANTSRSLLWITQSLFIMTRSLQARGNLSRLKKKGQNNLKRLHLRR